MKNRRGKIAGLQTKTTKLEERKMDEKGFIERFKEKLISKLAKSAWTVYTQSENWFGIKFAANTFVNLLEIYLGVELDGKSIKLDVSLLLKIKKCCGGLALTVIPRVT